MFSDIKVPFDSVMLYNVAKLKDDVSMDDIEIQVGTMCNVVKNKYKREESKLINKLVEEILRKYYLS